MKRTPVYLVLAAALVLALIAGPVAAQGDLEQSFTSLDGQLSYQLPAGWITFDIGAQQILAANSQASFDNLMGGEDPRAGDLLLLIIGPASLQEEFEFDEEATIEDIVEIMQADIADEEDVQYGEIMVEPLPDGRPSARVESTENSPFGAAVILVEDNGQFYGLAAIAGPDTYADHRDTVEAVALSITVTSAEDVAASFETATLDWVVEDVMVNIDGAMAMADDRVYISDGASGVLIFSLDGEQLGQITHPDFFAPGSPALAGDGNLWLADNFESKVFLVTPEGEIVFSFGDEETFGGLTPDFVAVRPDGNLYVTNQVDEVDTIQVYTPEGELVDEWPIGDLDSFIWTVEMGPEGEIYAVDLVQGIRVYNPDGDLIIESFAAAQTRFQFVSAFAALPDGTFWLAREVVEGEDEEYTLVHLDAEGEVLGRFRAADLGLDAIYSPMDFALTPDGDVIVSDGNVNGSQIFRLSVSPAME